MDGSSRTSPIRARQGLPLRIPSLNPNYGSLKRIPGVLGVYFNHRPENRQHHEQPSHTSQQRFRNIKNCLNEKMPSSSLTVFVNYSSRRTAIDPEAERAYTPADGCTAFCKYTLCSMNGRFASMVFPRINSKSSRRSPSRRERSHSPFVKCSPRRVDSIPIRS